MTTKETFKYRGYSATCRVESVYIDIKTLGPRRYCDKNKFIHYYTHVTTITKDDGTDYFIIYSNRNRYIKWAIDVRIASSRK